jgi:hypothetical protein
LRTAEFVTEVVATRLPDAPSSLSLAVARCTAWMMQEAKVVSGPSRRVRLSVDERWMGTDQISAEQQDGPARNSCITHTTTHRCGDTEASVSTFFPGFIWFADGEGKIRNISGFRYLINTNSRFIAILNGKMIPVLPWRLKRGSLWDW